jgi:hypothetical protein
VRGDRGWQATQPVLVVGNCSADDPRQNACFASNNTKWDYGFVSETEDLEDESLPPGDDQVPGYDEPVEEAEETEESGVVPPT